MKTKKQAAEIVAALEAEYPISECFLDSDDAWQLLVAVRLSAQCTDLRVNATTPILFGKFPTIDALADADPKEIEEIVKNVMLKDASVDEKLKKRKELESKERRLKQISTIMMKMYDDNAAGIIDDKRLSDMIIKLQKEADALSKELDASKSDEEENLIKYENYQKFFALAKQYSKIEELDRDMLITFIERIEVGPKILPEGYKRATHTNSPCEQTVKIYYKFIGTASELS